MKFHAKVCQYAVITGCSLASVNIPVGYFVLTISCISIELRALHVLWQYCGSKWIVIHVPLRSR